MPPEGFVELKKGSGFAVALRNIQRIFLITNQVKKHRRKGWKIEVNVPILRDALRRAEEENFVFPDRSAACQTVIETAKTQRFRYGFIQRVRGIESLVTMKERADSVKLIAAALGDDINNRSRCLSEFGFVAGRQHLKFGNRFLIKLRRRTAVDGIFVRVSVNKEIVIAAAFAENRIGIIAVRLPIDGNARNKLEQIEIVAPVDRQLDNLPRRNRQAGSSRIFIQQGCFVCHGNYFRSVSHLQTHIKSQGAIERQLEVRSAGGKACLRNRQGICSRRQCRQTIKTFRVGRGGSLGGKCRSARFDRCSGNQRPGSISDSSFNCRSGSLCGCA